jgi:hypothetical protein
VLIRLTYDLRRGLITGVLSGQRMTVLARPSQGSLQEWENLQELHAGAWTPTDYGFDLPSKGTVATGVVRRIGSGSTSVSATHRSPLITITRPSGGFHIHGWPPCDLASCLVVSRGWEEFSRALARDGEQRIDFYVVI